MGWDKGRYYTRSRKVQGRVVREYVGTGRVADLAARSDALARERRRLDILEVRDEIARLKALEGELESLVEAADLAARSALLAAGFHQHKRGEWRRRRERDTD